MKFLQRLRRRMERSGSAGAQPEFQTTSMLAAQLDKPAQERPVEITVLSKNWLIGLPRDVRPMQLAKRHPRVVNQIALCWRDHELTERVLSSLIMDERGGRQGFAAEVLAELMNLREFHADRKDGGDDADALWADSTLAIADR